MKTIEIFENEIKQGNEEILNISLQRVIKNIEFSAFKGYTNGVFDIDPRWTRIMPELVKKLRALGFTVRSKKWQVKVDWSNPSQLANKSYNALSAKTDSDKTNDNILEECVTKLKSFVLSSVYKHIKENKKFNFVSYKIDDDYEVCISNGVNNIYTTEGELFDRFKNQTLAALKKECKLVVNIGKRFFLYW